MRDAAGRLLRLVEEVLSFARLDADREALRVEPTLLSNVLEDTMALLDPIAMQKGLQLIVDAPEPELIIETDGWKLRHVLSNLLSNAVKFTEHGSVELRVRRTGDRVLFELSDTGIGIAAENSERIFEPFWQIEQSATRRYEGSGLGLGVARELARLLGGDIDVTSELGKGSTFRMEIPIKISGSAR
jgi:signal transduction histidine kinase